MVFESAMVNEPSVFQSSSFYCTVCMHCKKKQKKKKLDCADPERFLKGRLNQINVRTEKARAV